MATKYYNKMGRQMRGDEETDAYSDGEGEQDSTSKRKQNKTETQVVNAYTSMLRDKTKKIFSRSNPGNDNELDTTSEPGTTRLGFALEGVNTLNQRTMQRARDIDPAAQTLIYSATTTERGTNNLDQNVTRTNVSYNHGVILNRWRESNYYIWFILVAVVGLVLSILLIWHILGKLSAYF
jgi:hypothetical protein